MTARRAMRRLAGAVVVATLPLAVALRSPSPSPEARRRSGRPLIEQRRRPDARLAAPIDRRNALAIARRFATAYADWDAGQRGVRVARRLGRTASADVIASLRDEARPVARRPTPLALTPAGVYADGTGSYIVPLVLRAPASFHVVTLVVAPTERGPRVTRIER